MPTLTATDESPVIAEPAGPAPRLRLRRQGAPERLVPLTDGKCTIGSSPRCHVQLPGADAKPLQCLLALESGAAIVTRWAAGVLLNGREFSKQTLRGGDRLSIGPWELLWDVADAAADRPAPARAPLPGPLEAGVAAPPAPQRETVDFRPGVSASVAPLAARPAPGAIDAHAASQRAVSPAARPAAKTTLVASRQTDPFAGLLGPAKPEAAHAAGATAGPDGPDRAMASASLAFEDRLVVRLWSANFAARRRARSLVAALRVARERAAELRTTLAALETEAAAESARNAAQSGALSAQLENLAAELQQAVAERDRLTAELHSLRNARPGTPPPDPRLQTLADALAAAEAQAAELRQQLQTQQSQLQIATRQCEAAEAARSASEAARVAADQELAAQRQAAPALHAQLEAQLRDQKLAAGELQSAWDSAQKAWDEERQIGDAEAARLREQLYACELQIEVLREQVAEADTARAGLQEQLTQVQKQQADWLQQCGALERERLGQIAQITGERDDLQRQLDQRAARPGAPAAEASSWQPAVDWDAEVPAPSQGWPDGAEGDSALADVAPTGGSQVDRFTGQSAEFPAGNDVRPDRGEDQSNGIDQAPLEPAPRAIATPPAAPRKPSTPAGTSPLAALVVEPAPAAAAPTSFIDKYRHLLDDDTADAGPGSHRARPLLDEEHLSPAKASFAAADDDSDEALEAYMSSMMQRVRGDASLAPSSQAPPSEPRASSADAASDSAGECGAGDPAPPAVDEPEVVLDANGLQRLARRNEGSGANLAALRELANNSARTAIAHHRRRRHVESTLTKAIVCGIASAASTYLMLSAPGVESPLFWGGCVALVAAAGSAAQLGMIAWQRMTERGHSAGLPGHGRAGEP
ncbi:MAG TPA: FHA domain-containing protein [Lacipirellulaceae bacterium]|nr:FHA domain-containing protein [Lacipirellulaceae bacterium]